MVIVRERKEPASIDDAFIKIASELRLISKRANGLWAVFSLDKEYNLKEDKKNYTKLYNDAQRDITASLKNIEAAVAWLRRYVSQSEPPYRIKAAGLNETAKWVKNAHTEIAEYKKQTAGYAAPQMDAEEARLKRNIDGVNEILSLINAANGAHRIERYALIKNPFK